METNTISRLFFLGQFWRDFWTNGKPAVPTTCCHEIFSTDLSTMNTNNKSTHFSKNFDKYSLSLISALAEYYFGGTSFEDLEVFYEIGRTSFYKYCGVINDKYFITHDNRMDIKNFVTKDQFKVFVSEKLESSLKKFRSNQQTT